MKPKKTFLLSIISTLSIITSLIIPISAQTAETATLRVSFHDLAPWRLKLDNGEIEGIDIEFIKTLAERMKLKIEFVEVPIQRGFLMLKNGELDIGPGVLKTPEREEFLYFIEPPYKLYSNKAFYVLKGKENTILKYEDLYKLTIGTNPAKFFKPFDDDPKLKKEEAFNAKLNIDKLLAKRIDTYIWTEATGDFLLAEMNLGEKIVKAKFLYKEKNPVYMVLSKNSPLASRRNEFNNTMKLLVDSDPLEMYSRRFYKKYKEAKKKGSSG